MAASVRLSDAMERWERAMRGDLAAGTISDRMSTMRKFLKTTGDLYVKSLSHKHIDEYFSVYSHWSPRTRNKVRLHLNIFFKWCISRDLYRDVNPMEGRRKPPLPQRKHLHLTNDQMEEMLESVEEPRDRILIALQYYLALRTSEVLPIRWGDLSDDWTRVLVLRSKKGGTYEDLIAVRGLLRQELQRWRLTLCRQMSVARPNPEWYIVCQKASYCGRSPSGHFLPAVEFSYEPTKRLKNGWRQVKEALKSIGIDVRGEATHTLRRSAADRIMREADDRGAHGIRVAQRQLAHKSQRTTELYIDHDRDRDIADTLIESLDDDGPGPQAPDAEIYVFPVVKEG